MNVSDLNFEAHPAGMGGTRAKHTFENGFGVSVITGAMFYTDENRPYEIAVTDKDGITYDTHITDDVIGHLSEAEANKIIADVAALKPA